MELGVPPYLINATLLGVLAQRLVRTLCKQCKVADDQARVRPWREVVKPWQMSGAYKPYKPVGCVDCRMTGFMGRIGLVRAAGGERGVQGQSQPRAQHGRAAPPGRGDGMRPLASGRGLARGRGPDGGARSA